jgi:hypothetical protein
MDVDLSTIPVLPLSRPRRIELRYERETRRLYVWGSNCNLDMSHVGNMIRDGQFRHGVEAVIHTAPSGIVSIGSLSR